jgi:hypothetical protein
MIKIDSIDKAFAYSVGRLDLDTGKINSEAVKAKLAKMKEYCKVYGEFGEKRQETCPNYTNCRFHPIPSNCQYKMSKSLYEVLKDLDI